MVNFNYSIHSFVSNEDLVGLSEHWPEDSSSGLDRRLGLIREGLKGIFYPTVRLRSIGSSLFSAKWFAPKSKRHPACSRVFSLLGVLSFFKSPIFAIGVFESLKAAFDKTLPASERAEHFFNALNLMGEVGISAGFVGKNLEDLINVPDQASKFFGPLIVIGAVFLAPSLLFQVKDIYDRVKLSKEIQSLQKKGASSEDFFSLFLGPKNDESRQRLQKRKTQRYFDVSQEIIEDLNQLREKIETGDAIERKKAIQRLHHLVEGGVARSRKLLVVQAYGLFTDLLDLVAIVLFFSPAAPVGGMIGVFNQSLKLIQEFGKDFWVGKGLDLGASENWEALQKFLVLQKKMKKGCEKELQQTLHSYVLELSQLTPEEIKVRFFTEEEQAQNILQEAVLLASQQNTQEVTPFAVLYHKEMQANLERLREIDQKRLEAKFRTRSVHILEGSEALLVQSKKISNVSRVSLETLQKDLATSSKYFKTLRGRGRIDLYRKAISGSTAVICIVAFSILIFTPAWPVSIALVALAIALSIGGFFLEKYLERKRTVSKRFISEYKKVRAEKAIQVCQKAVRELGLYHLDLEKQKKGMPPEIYQKRLLAEFDTQQIISEQLQRIQKDLRKEDKALQRRLDGIFKLHQLEVKLMKQSAKKVFEVEKGKLDPDIQKKWKEVEKNFRSYTQTT